MNANLPRPSALAVLLACACWTAFSYAGKPEWAGGPHAGKGQADKHSVEAKQERHGGKRADRAAPVTVGGYFAEQQRVAARNYYEGRKAAGKGCPPGLAKKNNGCLPPGQARKWAVGQPLASDVVFYPVPQALVVQLGVPPAGYRYVRVASDILLIGTGTRMVIDGIEDLMR